MRPRVIAFDAVETLFSLQALDAPLAAIGAPPGLRDLWFTRLLRDGFALTTSGTYQPFATVADASLAGVFPTATTDERQEVLTHFGQLDAYPDVRPALAQVAEAGLRAVILTNGSAETTTALVRRNGLEDLIGEIMSVEAVQRWKPAPEPYGHVARRTGVEPSEIALVAVHAWDVHGAARAGLVTGWCARLEGDLGATFLAPDVRGDDLTSVVDGLLRR